MATRQWTLIDVASQTYLDEVTIGPDDVAGAARGYSVTKRTRRGGLSDSVEVVHVSNGAFSFDVLPTRGMSLWKAWLGDLEIGWRSPVRGPVHPKFVPLMEPGGLGWLDGFDELLVRCGLESNGAPDFDDSGRLRYPLHGRIGNRPAYQVEVSIDGDTGEITVTGVVEEIRFHFLKARLTSTVTTRVGEPGLRIHDTVENLSGSPAEIQMLYHINFGQPLLEAGSRFVAPVKMVVPRNARAAEGIATWDSYTAAAAGYEEQVYFLELLGAKDGTTQALLKNAQGTLGVSMHLNLRQLPCYTVWKNTTSLADGYATGLEPGVNFPNPRSYEGRQGRVVKLAPGGKAFFDLRLEVHQNAAEIEQAEAAITRLQAGVKPEIYDEPQAGWCVP